jgi:hypothetical protein
MEEAVAECAEAEAEGHGSRNKSCKAKSTVLMLKGADSVTERSGDSQQQQSQAAQHDWQMAS